MIEQSDRRFWVLAGLTALVLAVAYGPLLTEFFANQWLRPQYQYFPFVIGAFVWLVWQRCSQAVPRNTERAQPSSERQVTSGETTAANRYDVVVALVATWLLLGFAYIVGSPWLAYLSLICLVTSCFFRVTSQWNVPYLWGVWLLLWLVVPLPMNRDQYLINSLQSLSSKLSSFVLDWVGVSHLMEGNTLILPSKQFFVDEACSGIVSVMSIIACAVIYGVWRNRRPLHLIVLAGAGIGWATLMNVVRISVIAMAYQWYGVDWSKGTPHEMVGLAIFLCTFGALVSTDFALVVLLAPVHDAYIRGYGDAIYYGSWIVTVWDWLQGWGNPAAYAVASSEWRGASGTEAGQGDTETRLGARGTSAGSEQAIEVEQRSSGVERASHPYPGPLPQGEEILNSHLNAVPRGEGAHGLAWRFVLGTVPLVIFAVLGGAQFAVRGSGPVWQAALPHNIDRALAMEADSLPAQMHDAQRTSFTKQERDRDDVFGNFSRVYEYRDDRGYSYIVSCDFPLESGGHELTMCYQGIGWSMLRRELKTAPEDSIDGPATWGFAEADFVKPDGSRAFLAYCSFDEYGTRFTPQTYSFWDDLWRALRRQSQGRESAKSFTVQVWTIAAGKVDEAQKEVARDLLLGARERFREWVVGEKQVAMSN